MSYRNNNNHIDPELYKQIIDFNHHKTMRQEVDNIIYYPKQNNQFDYKKLFLSIIRIWYWFAISIFIGIFAAWLYIRYMPAEYSIRSSLIVNEYESGIKRLSLSQNSPYERNIDVLGQDHAGRIKSHMLSLSTLQSLGWNVFWYQKTPLYDKDLYGNEPYKLTLLPNKTNLTDVNVLISELSDSEFQVDVNSNLPNRNIRVKFTSSGKFGEPFENNYFGFTIEKVGGRLAAGKKIFFEIKNLNNLALIFQKKLTVIANEKKPDLMELILAENNAQRGVDFLNRLEKTYIEYGLDEKNSVAENTIKFIDGQLKSVTDSLSDSESRFTNFRARSQSLNLNRRVGGFSSQLSLLPRTEQQLSSLKRSLELNNELYTYLLKMRAESAITYASNQPDVKVLDPAQNETSKQTSPILIIDYIFGIM